MRRVLELLRACGFRRARATTGDHPFFEPAQRMYQACGFEEVKRGSCDRHPALGTIHYELSLEIPPRERPDPARG